MPRTIGATSSPVLAFLNAVPMAVTTPTLIVLAAGNRKRPRPTLWNHIRRLSRDRMIVRVGSGRKGAVAWMSSKWRTSTGTMTGTYYMATSTREELPARRRTVSQKVKIAGQTVHYSIGLYSDGRPGELWLEVAKAGAALRAWAGEAAMMVSIALQHGTPLATILNLFIGTRNQPCGEVEGHDRIKFCTSIMDCIARDMAITFLGREDLAEVPDWSVVPVPISATAELPPPTEGQTCVCHQSTDSGT